MTTLVIEGVGVCGAGLPDWPAARAILRGDASYAPATPPRPTPVGLPATERRRANDTARWALQVAAEATRALPAPAVAALPTVFMSADGDGDVLAQVLRDIATRPVTVSPTTFHNSVYNAPAGYWSIAAQARAASTTLCAGEGSFAAGLLEAAAQVADAGLSVLLVAYDLPFAASSPLRTDARAAFACALLLAPAADACPALGRIDHLAPGTGPASAMPAQLAATFVGNGAAAALPLLHAIACELPADRCLPYVDDLHVTVRWTPGA